MNNENVDKIRVPLKGEGYYLVAQKWDVDIAEGVVEIDIWIEDKDGVVIQDIVRAGQRYIPNNDGTVSFLEDIINLKIFGNAYDEDYTEEIDIPIYDEYKEVLANNTDESDADDPEDIDNTDCDRYSVKVYNIIWPEKYKKGCVAELQIHVPKEMYFENVIIKDLEMAYELIADLIASESAGYKPEFQYVLYQTKELN